MEEELDIESVFKFKVDELKLELGKRGLIKTGGKPDLQERLLQYVTNKSYKKDYDIVDPSSGDIEGLKDISADTSIDLDKSDALEISIDKTDHFDVSPDKAEVIDDKMDRITDLADEEVIDTVKTPNEDDASIPVEDDDDDIDVHISPDKTDRDDISKDIITITIDKNDITDSSIDDSQQSSSKKVKIAKISSSGGDRKESRSKRFGEITSETEKKKARLGRFFSTVSGLGKGEPVTDEDVEKIKKRAERFGKISTIVTTPEISKDRLKLRQERFADNAIKKRQERFGVVEKQTLDLETDMSVRKQKRLAKFGAV